MARHEHREHLRAVPLLAHLDNKQLDEVVRVADQIQLPAGHVLAQQGAVGFDMVILLAGTADVSRDGEVVNTVGAGTFVGEMALLTDYRRNATVVARTDLDVLVLTRRGLDQLLDDIPGLAKALLLQVVERTHLSLQDADAG